MARIRDNDGVFGRGIALQKKIFCKADEPPCFKLILWAAQVSVCFLRMAMGEEVDVARHPFDAGIRINRRMTLDTRVERLSEGKNFWPHPPLHAQHHMRKAQVDQAFEKRHRKVVFHFQLVGYNLGETNCGSFREAEIARYPSPCNLLDI